MDIKLNVINRSNDDGNNHIVIFQKNVAIGADESAVVWKVIHNLSRDWFHPIDYPAATQVSSSDSYGNYTPRLDAQPGQSFACDLTNGSDTLTPAGDASRPGEVQIVNRASEGAIDAQIYRDGELLATRTSIAPQQLAAFEFEPTIWIGIATEVDQGQVMNSAVVESIDTELSLLGIRYADIVMAGGGPGPDAQPLTFNLENVVRP